MIKLSLLFMILSSSLLAGENWAVISKNENGFDIIQVYASESSTKPLLVVRADGRSFGYKGSDEVYINSVKKRFLVTRWDFGVTGTETIKVYDPLSKSKKEVYKLQSMPSEIKVNENGLTFIIPTGPGTFIQADWVAK